MIVTVLVLGDVVEMVWHSRFEFETHVVASNQPNIGQGTRAEAADRAKISCTEARTGTADRRKRSYAPRVDLQTQTGTARLASARRKVCASRLTLPSGLPAPTNLPGFSHFLHTD